ncbi:MAG: hypothetical protein IK062_04115 [Selenomonadaceae bacterium]|nr:hypothetical protein [Selenomonadaceae bacterium]
MQDNAKQIINIIKENFSNGIRNDFIDINKVLKIYLNSYPEEQISRDFTIDVIRLNGIKAGTRFYFVSENDIERILLVFDAILEKYSIVYYSTAYEKHKDFFSKLNIFSFEVLRKILQENGDENFYFAEFCSSSRMTRLNYEISKIFMESDTSWSLEDLQKIFLYVPEEKIFAELSTKKYLPTVAGKFFAVSKIKFNREEIVAAGKKISAVIEEKNFAMPEDYSLFLNFSLNPEIDEKVLLELIHKKFFADKFAMSGKKFLKKSSKPVNFIKEAMGKFLSERDEINFEELLKYSKKVCNNSPNSFFMALNYGSKFMIRVVENLFVKDSRINFDVAGIDEALTPFVQNKIIPLRAVTSFTGFPPVEGYSWNLFLLESFLRKYSKKFTYDAPSSNNLNIGAIYPKSMKFSDYLDVQVAVIIQENILLEKSAVENFLVEQGYRANRIKKVTEQIMKKVQDFSTF